MIVSIVYKATPRHTAIRDDREVYLVIGRKEQCDAVLIIFPRPYILTAGISI